MAPLSLIENSIIYQYTLISSITEKLGLNMSLNEEGWVVRDHNEHFLVMSTRQVPKEVGALEEKLRRVFLTIQRI